MKQIHSGKVLAEMLRRQNVKHVFGVPGVQTMPLYEGIYDSQGDVVHICMRDESGAAFAAEAYAKSYSIERPSDIAPVLKEARGLGEPALLDVRIDYDETPVIPYQKDMGGQPSFG